MTRNKKLAYSATFIIIIGLAAVAYYAYLQANHLQLTFDDVGRAPIMIKKQEASAQSEKSLDPTPGPTPPPISPAGKNPTQKIESFLIDADIFTARPDYIEVSKGSQVNLIITTSSLRSGEEGLVFQSDYFTSTSIPPGSNKTISFTAEADFQVQILDAESQLQAPPTIYIKVK